MQKYSSNISITTSIADIYSYFARRLAVSLNGSMKHSAAKMNAHMQKQSTMLTCVVSAG